MGFPDDVVRPDNQRKEIGAERPGRFERVQLPAAVRGLDRGSAAVGDDLPFGRSENLERVGALDVGLIELREKPVRLVRFEVRVEVFFTVFGIFELVKAIPFVVVLVFVDDTYRICEADGGAG